MHTFYKLFFISNCFNCISNISFFFISFLVVYWFLVDSVSIAPDAIVRRLHVCMSFYAYRFLVALCKLFIIIYVDALLLEY